MRKIPIDKVEPGMINNITVPGFLGQALLNEGVQIKSRHIYYLKQMGIDYLYVKDSRMAEITCKDLISSEVRSEGRALIAGLIRDLDTSVPNPKVINSREKDIISYVEKIIVEIKNNENPVIQFSDLRAHAGYLFAHSVNCCVISTLLASRMNYDINTQRLIAMGAFLHDIGYISIPQMILHKPGCLTEKEFELVKTHARYGYSLFKKTRLFSERVAEIILQHHERILGQGYPGGLKGKEINALARIVAVADVFDAISSDKSYRGAYQAHEAVKMMQSWSGDYFDPEIINAFMGVVAAYPIGSYVTLNNGESGLVVTNKTGCVTQPVVRVLYKKDFTPHPSPYDLDLAKNDYMSVAAVTDDSTVL